MLVNLVNLEYNCDGRCSFFMLLQDNMEGHICSWTTHVSVCQLNCRDTEVHIMCLCHVLHDLISAF